MTGIYIHLPFCLRKCPYCAFYSVKFGNELKNGYLAALKASILEYRGREIEVDSVYFGGGTPSLLSACEISDILDTLKESFDISADCEITVEANPSSTDFQKLCGYRKAGVNRISFGVQSADDKELEMLGRLHNFEGAKDAVNMAYAAGFENISCDLMIGIPKQTVGSLLVSATALVNMNIPHISCYMLKIEEGTPFDCDGIRSLSADDDTVSDMYLALCDHLKKSGYDRYEISNFSKPGFESRHNNKYWRLENYIGFGPGAHSYLDGKRFYVEPDIDKFNSFAFEPVTEDDDCNVLEEYIMLSLRLSDGISLDKITELGGDALAVVNSSEKYIKAGLIERDGDRLFLTDSGALVSNTLIVEVYLAAVRQNS